MNLLKYGKLQQDPSKLTETVTVKVGGQKKPSGILKEGLEASEFLMPRIEAIHAGRTRNYNHYLADKLKGDSSIGSGVHSWLQPYGKPVIYNHDTSTEATGRIVSAAYADYTQAGRPGIILIPKITEPKAVQALQDGRLLTVSIGATSDGAICSICGTDIVNEGYCGHMKGEEYNGQVAEWISGNIWFDELSWVNVPADSDAMVVDTQSSVFLDVPKEDGYLDAVNNESAPEDQYKQFGVPKHTKLVVVESKGFKNNIAENKIQEENHEMDNELEKDLATEPEVTTPVEPEVPEATDDSVDKSKGETPEDKTADETDETKETKTEPEVTTEPEVEPEVTPEAPATVSEPEVTTDAELKAENVQLAATAVGLAAQVESLTSEIKSLYISQIVEKSEISEDKLVLFKEKLAKRSTDSLKDRLEDLEEELSINVSKPEQKESRVVTKVNSPVATTESTEKKTLTNEDKIKTFARMFSNK